MKKATLLLESGAQKSMHQAQLLCGHMQIDDLRKLPTTQGTCKRQPCGGHCRTSPSLHYRRARRGQRVGECNLRIERHLPDRFREAL